MENIAVTFAISARITAAQIATDMDGFHPLIRCIGKRYDFKSFDEMISSDLRFDKLIPDVEKSEIVSIYRKLYRYDDIKYGVVVFDLDSLASTVSIELDKLAHTGNPPYNTLTTYCIYRNIIRRFTDKNDVESRLVSDIVRDEYEEYIDNMIR